MNETLKADLHDLTIVDKLLDEKFSIEEKAAFDMEMVINSTKTSADVYDNLAHYLFNEMIKAQDSAGDSDFFSPWTSCTIFGWIISCVALVLVAFKGSATVFHADGSGLACSIFGTNAA